MARREGRQGQNPEPQGTCDTDHRGATKHTPTAPRVIGGDRVSGRKACDMMLSKVQDKDRFRTAADRNECLANMNAAGSHFEIN